MNTSKKINVNFSSLVGLKAELLRKQTEVKAAKLKAESVRTIPTFKKKVKRSKEEEEGKQQEPTDLEDIGAHKKSRLMLQAKARLYERLKKCRNDTENFLVDFSKKSDEESEEDVYPEEVEDEELDSEDAWVEYKDCFGRTRKCLRKDLEIMKEKDELVKRQIMKKKANEEDENKDKHSNVPEIEKEPEIEIMRRKWEEQTQKLAGKVDIHYQDILFDEARAHGIGYFAFSQDEDERIKQQENLFELRKQTERKQREAKELQEIKDRMEANRLKAARIRRRIRAGLPAEPTEDEEHENFKENADSINSLNEETPVEDSSIKGDQNTVSIPQKTEVVDDPRIQEDKIKAFEEILDRRPRWREMSQEEWVHARRQERKTEFAPSYDNFKRGGFLHNSEYKTTDSDNKYSHGSPNNLDKSDDVLDDDSDIIGPLPSTETCKNNINNCNTKEYICKFEETIDSSEIDNKINACNPFNSNNQNSTLHVKMNEESIAAGLKYLREKFEESHNK